MSLKNTFLASLVTLGAVASAQSQEVIDSTAKSLEVSLAGDNNHDYYVATPVANKGIPTYENPRPNSIVDLVKNQGIDRGYYKDANGHYVQFHPKTGSKKWYITIKLCDEYGYVIDKFDLDSKFAAANTFLNGSRSQSELENVVSYCASVPMKEKIVFTVGN